MLRLTANLLRLRSLGQKLFGIGAPGIPMLVLRLDPPIEVTTPKGKGWAVIWRDYGFDHDDLWTVLISETKEFWTFRNNEVRGADNVTFGIGAVNARPSA
jgi:hypothetical protein